jgi:hypothetical protein
VNKRYVLLEICSSGSMHTADSGICNACWHKKSRVQLPTRSKLPKGIDGIAALGAPTGAAFRVLETPTLSVRDIAARRLRCQPLASTCGSQTVRECRQKLANSQKGTGEYLSRSPLIVRCPVCVKLLHEPPPTVGRRREAYPLRYEEALPTEGVRQLLERQSGT